MDVPSFSAARRLLDQVYSLRELVAVDPLHFLARLGDQPPPEPIVDLDELGAWLDGLRGLLDEIDRFAAKAMRIRVDHVLDPAPVTREFRVLIGTTVLGYAEDVPLLKRRVAAAIARHDAATAHRFAEEVGAVAEAVLALREELRRRLFDFLVERAQGLQPAARRASREPTRDARDQDRWRRARWDLEQIAARPDRLARAPFARRLGEAPGAEDEPAEPPAEPEHRFWLLDID